MATKEELTDIKNACDATLIKMVTDSNNKLEKRLNRFEDDVRESFREMTKEVSGVKESLQEISVELKTEIREFLALKKATDKLYNRVDELEEETTRKFAKMRILIQENTRICGKYKEEKNLEKETATIIRRQFYGYAFGVLLILLLGGITSWIVTTANKSLLNNIERTD